MPIIINELIIRAEVTSHATGGTADSASGDLDREALVSDCVEQVLHILDERKGR